MRVLLLATLVAAAAAGAVELTADNFDELTGGKNAFVKPVSIETFQRGHPTAFQTRVAHDAGACSV